MAFHSFIPMGRTSSIISYRDSSSGLENDLPLLGLWTWLVVLVKIYTFFPTFTHNFLPKQKNVQMHLCKCVFAALWYLLVLILPAACGPPTAAAASVSAGGAKNTSLSKWRHRPSSSLTGMDINGETVTR